MRRAKDQHLVQALGAYSANQPLHIWILPRRVCRQKLSWGFGAIHVYVAAAGEGAAGGAERSSLSKTTHIGGSKDISCGWQFERCEPIKVISESCCAAESKRGQHSQSMEPSQPTKAAVLQLPISA
jgi:hypothetical protein